MASNVLMPQPKLQFFTAAGSPLTGGNVYTYAAGTNNPKTTFTNAAGTAQQPNPIPLNARGEPDSPVFWNGAYKVEVHDAAGNVVYTVDNYSTDPLGVSNLFGPDGANHMNFTQGGPEAATRTVQDELRDVVKITQYGAAFDATAATNKAALQKAITAVDLDGGGYIIVPGGIDYGYVRTDLSTHPDFTGCTTSISVIDYGIGSSYGAPAKDGAQIRQFFFTPNPGNDDGNIIYHRGPWHPALLISNDSNLAAPGDPSRADLDNRRVSIFFENDGESTWRVGQGDRVGKLLTEEELSSFVIESYARPGDTLGNWAPLIIERKTGNFAFGQGNTTPQASYYFKPITPGYPTMIVEGLDTAPSFILRNSNGSAQDIRMQNRAGDWVFNFPSLGDAVYIKGTTRYMGIGAAGNFMLDVADSRNGSYAAKISNLDATQGRILYLASGTAPAAGWDALTAEAAAGNVIFRLRGDGNGMCDGSWTGGGADRAEMFEWADGNPTGTNGEKKEVGSNRAGYSVALVDGKIKICEAGEVPIGVVSLTYDSLGNAAPLNWAGKFLNDDLGCPVMEACETVEWVERILLQPAKEATPPVERTVIRGGKPYTFTDPGAPAEVARYDVKKHSYYADAVPDGVTVPPDAVRTAGQRRRLNQAFDQGADYVPRTARKEWDAVGILGVCRVRKGQALAPTWLKMRDISDQVEEWLVR